MNAAEFQELTGETVTEFADRVGISRETIYHQLRRGSCSLVSKAQNKYHRSHYLRGVYDAMLRRCYSKNDPAYHNYGGRGIRVCPEWFYSFDRFVEDIGERPHGHSIDRIDNNGNYSPENVRWATRAEQNSNRRPRSEWTIKSKVKYKSTDKENRRTD